MKRILTKTSVLIAFLVLSFSSTKAQYVTISNSGLLGYLSTQFPNCFNGNQMDTTCAEILSTTTLNLTDSPLGFVVSNLNGIKYFKNLQTLNCDYNLLGNINGNVFPPSLKWFSCAFCETVTFSNSPDSLEYLNLVSSWIVNIPALPNTLKYLNLANNDLDLSTGSFPILPDSIEFYDCSYNNLPSNRMPQVYPSTLKTLICSNNNLTGLAPLPNGLKYLDMSVNQIASLPAILPDSLITFNCSSNLISGPINNLPNSITDLKFAGNLVTSIANFPPSLIKLYCGGNLMTSLPPLPTTLKELSYGYNNIPSVTFPPNLTYLECANTNATSLSTLPSTLLKLYCNRNQISTLPSLPNSLTDLFCMRNMLTTLPTLPNGLLFLRCTNNLLSTLPPLPTTIQNLQLDTNNITCLPLLPNTNYLAILSNPITCLPNYIASMNAATLAIPLCEDNDLINNPAGCAAAKGILGTIYKDYYSNCIYYTGFPKLKNVKVKFFNPITNQFGSTYSASNGVFNYATNTGTYVVLVDTLDLPFSINCIYPGIDTTVITTASTPLASNVNFILRCKPSADINVRAIGHKDGIVFPGQQHTLAAFLGDASTWYGLNCSSGTTGQVHITINGPVTYSGIAAGALTPSINGNIYTYTIADFATVNNNFSFGMLFTVDNTAQVGNQICVHVEVVPDSGDYNPSNNTMDFCYLVTNSYDPNFKEVYPKDVLPGFQDWLTYTVHFQNLGNAPAINIRVLDTLDANLDMETFEVINYSHYNTVTLMDGILDFRFPNIQLPDSASNPSGSQGFVQYRIKPKANLIAGTQLENTAHIYFDFNSAVVTNTTVNNFIVNVGNASLSENKKMFVYPNPSTGIFTISATANVEVYNLLGEVVLLENNTTTIDLSNAPKGVYFVKLNGSNIKKLVKN